MSTEDEKEALLDGDECPRTAVLVKVTLFGQIRPLVAESIVPFGRLHDLPMFITAPNNVHVFSDVAKAVSKPSSTHRTFHRKLIRNQINMQTAALHIICVHDE
jgi:hypothetical protein